MKLTLTREQIPLARETVAFIRSKPGEQAALQSPERRRGCPGWRDWYDLNVKDGEWASALEAAITEAEHPMQVITLAKPGDADERAFWRAVFTEVHSGDKRDPTTAADQADEALDRYRKAFYTGMPSDQKGAK